MPDMMFQALDLTGLNETAEQVRAIVQAAKAEIEAELDSLDYAQPDGIYPEMTVGAVIGADETAQWATRESTGSGSAIVRSVHGAAVAWNQLNRNALYTGTTSGVTFTNNSDGSWTLSGTATGDANKILDVISCPADHKLLLKGCIGGSISTYYMGIGGTITDVGSGGIVTSGATNNLRVDFKSGVSFGDGVTIYPQVFDLTAMFGSGNEPTTVAEFEQMYPASYYPYSAPVLKPVQIAGIASTDAQGGELDSVEWTAFTLRGAGTIGDMLYSDHVETRVGVLVLTGNELPSAYNYSTYTGYILNNVLPESGMRKAYSSSDFGSANSGTVVPNTTQFAWLGVSNTNLYLQWADCPYATAADLTAWLQQRYASGNPVTFYYALETSITAPISPALPMTYNVQAGGSESIIVPNGEISAAPIITIAEPVNMSTELALIWAAIEALQGSRGSSLGSVHSDSDVSSTEVKEAPTMDEKQTTERESEI